MARETELIYQVESFLLKGFISVSEEGCQRTQLDIDQ